MRLAAILVCVVAALRAQGMGPGPDAGHSRGNGFTATYSVAVDRTKMGANTLSNFTVLISVTTGTDFKLAGSGGSVTSSSGYDIVVATDTTCTTYVPWEVEYWNSGDGTWIAWAKLSSVNGSAAASNTTFAVCVGNTAITTQRNTGSYAATAVWPSAYKGVWHLQTTSGLADSTSNSNTLVVNNPGNASSVTGKIDGGVDTPNNSPHAYFTTATNGSLEVSSITASVWFARDFNSTGTLLSKPYQATWSNPFRSYGILVGGDTSMTYTVATGGTLHDYTVTVPSLGTGWHYAVLTYDGTTLAAYLDGALVNSTTAYSGAIVYGSDQPLWINSDLAGSPLPTTTDEVRVLSVANTASWITSEFGNQSNPGNVGTDGFLVWRKQ